MIWMSKLLRIVHLFPELLNLYADQGNIAVLAKRAQARDCEVSVQRVKLGDSLDLENSDILVLGGGSDREQAVVAKELMRYRADLLTAIEAGLPVLAVCGGYQLLGHYYELPNHEKIAGLGLLDFITKAGNKRLIGDIAISWLDEAGHDRGETIVGFENHGGRTIHSYPSLGHVLRGYGNNGDDQLEGLQYKGVVATYIHGPLLPKNPHLADDLLQKALRYRYGESFSWCSLDDQLAMRAHQFLLNRTVSR